MNLIRQFGRSQREVKATKLPYFIKGIRFTPLPDPDDLDEPWPWDPGQTVLLTESSVKVEFFTIEVYWPVVDIMMGLGKPKFSGPWRISATDGNAYRSGAYRPGSIMGSKPFERCVKVDPS